MVKTSSNDQIKDMTIELDQKQPHHYDPNQKITEDQQQKQISVSDINLKPKDYGKDAIRLDFQKINLDVKVKKTTKRILNEVSGFVCPGEILYIMGPSGGGKTCLLDFLCNRTKTDPSNNIYLNGQKWTETEFKKIAKYCQQQPLLYEILTVQETLDYAATFCTTSPKMKKERVDRAIALLGLENQRQTKIGGLFFRGISGGQKKRVSVGEQLVADPKLLFLDEPTTGLDSASAFQLMEKLKEICLKTGITVISSIHQPSQRVFEISDRVMILAGGKGFGGSVAYFGQTNQIDQYFRQSGIVNNSKASTSEWVLDEVNGDFGHADGIQKILDYYKNSQQKKELDSMENQLKSSSKTYKFEGDHTKQSNFKDIGTLVTRGFKNTMKNPLAFLMRVIVYCAMAFVIGTAWWQIGDEPDAGVIYDMAGVLYFAAAFFMIMTISVLPTYIDERLIMVKEKNNGFYSLESYSISQFLVGTPICFIVSLLPGLLVYFMVGFKAEDCPMFILDLFLSILASEGLMLIISSVFSNLLICIVMTAEILGSYMIMNGFYIKKSNIPDVWMWLHYGAYNTYTFQNFMKLIFNDTTIKANTDIVPPAPQDFPGKLVLKDLDMEDVEEGWNTMIVIGFMILFRVIAYIYSRYMHTGKK